MPEAEGGTSEKGKFRVGLGAAGRNGETLAAATEFARRRRKSRRKWRSWRIFLFGVGGIRMRDADPVIGESRVQIWWLDFGHVAGDAIFGCYGAGGAGMICGFFFG